jgi:hypothetical protein
VVNFDLRRNHRAYCAGCHSTKLGKHRPIEATHQQANEQTENKGHLWHEGGPKENRLKIAVQPA